MKIARVVLTLQVLEEMLPKGSRIVGVRENTVNDTVEVYVEHPDFEEVQPGKFAPVKALTVHTERHVSKVEYAS